MRLKVCVILAAAPFFNFFPAIFSVQTQEKKVDIKKNVKIYILAIWKKDKQKRNNLKYFWRNPFCN